MKEAMLTTIDNPFDPFTEYEKWYRYDIDKGYNTSAYLARIVTSSPELSDYDQQLDINNAIDEIVRLNLLGIYKKVTR